MLMIFIIYTTTILCTAYFNNISVDNYSLSSSDFKTIIVNSHHILEGFQASLNLPIENIRRDIIEMYKTKVKYNKLLFMDFNKLKNYINNHKYENFVIIIGEIVNEEDVFKEKENLILLGCKNSILYDGTYYFCVCPYNRCGIVCEYEKSGVVLNLLILAFSLILVLSFYKQKVEKEGLTPIRKNKMKIE